MATNQIVISSFQGWLANDRNRGQKWAFWDAQWVEIRKSSEYITLNRAVTELFDTWLTRAITALTLTNYNGSWTVNNEINAFTDEWKVFNYQEGEIFRTSTWDGIYNVFNANGYNYMITDRKIHRFTNAVKTNIVPYSDFTTWWNGTNWSSGVHTPWSSGSYSMTSPITTVSWARYHIRIVVASQSAWTCTFTIGWTTSSNLSVWVNHLYLVTSTTAWVYFAPSSDSTIVLTSITIDRVSDLTVSDWVWVKENVSTLSPNITKRPCINFFWDLIIGDGTQVARYNKDWTTYLYSATVEAPVIGWLDGSVYAITQVWANIYVWCNNGGSTNMYIWDWISSRPTQKITYVDKPVINVALLNNQHYWWAEKWPNSQKHIFIGEGYQAQRYISSDIPKAIATETLDDPDRLAVYWQNTNAIETFGDIVYFPWYGKIYGFWGYFPWDSIALNKEFTFSWTECTAMLTTSTTTLLQDYTFYMLVWYKNLSWTYSVWIIDFRDWNWGYTSSWYIETMEYIGENLGIEKNSKKLIVPFYLPHSSTSIKVYERKNQASSYTLLKTIDTTAYGTGFNTAEIPHEWKWNTIQYKFELITSNSTYTPRLHVGITDILTDTAYRG